MAIETGTATDYKDLLLKLKTFLTNGALLGAEVWTVKEWNTDWDGAGNYQLNVMGPGSGTDQIYVGIVTKHSLAQDWYNWYLNGYTGYTVGANFYSHPGSKILPAQSYLYGPSLRLWNNNIKYWFVANGRRFIVVVNVATTYQTAYLGYILPYGLPTQFPYPLFVGGAGYQNSTVYDYYQRYSSTNIWFKNFWSGYISGLTDASGFLLDGVWQAVGNFGTDDSPGFNCCNVWPYLNSLSDYPEQYQRFNAVWRKLKKNIDGTYPVFPTVIFGRAGGVNPNTYGELQGVYAIPGDGVVSEDTVTISGKDYLVVQDCFRTTLTDFAAILLE